MKRVLRLILLLAVAGGIVAAIVFAFLPEPVGVDLATVTRGPMQVTVDEDGTTRIQERYIVSAPLQGRLVRIELDPGDPVVVGETLVATIMPRDPDLLDARAVAQAEASVQAAEASLEKIQPLLAQARAAQEFAEEELQRQKQLSQRNVSTGTELDQAELNAKLRAEELRSAHIAEEIARFELAQAQAALLRVRPAENGNDPINGNGEANTQNATLVNNFLIHSPIDGRVLRVFKESAAVVTAGEELLELGDPDDLEIVVDVLSQDAVRISPGDPVRLEHWGGSNPLEGRVRLVEPAAFTKISTLGVEEQRVNVVIDLLAPPQSRGPLGDGFRVEARVVIWQNEEVLRLPTSALFRSKEDWAVFVAAYGNAKLTRVEIGQQNGLQAEVLSGLAEGDRVIIHPSDAVKDGVQIRQR